MGIGTRVRHRLGRWEVPAANLYRGVFVSLPALANQLTGYGPARRILEVGCGDGAFGTELTRVFPRADYLGIDIAHTAGRLYRGDARRANFRVQTVQELLADEPEPFDLVCLVDVLHHIPAHHRHAVLSCAGELTAPAGHLAVKEHQRDQTMSYRLVLAADRFVTGDRGVAFMSQPELHQLVDSIPGFGPRHQSAVPPLRNNVLCVRCRRTSPR